MTYITAQEDALLRTQPQRTKLYLSIYNPPTVLACQASSPGVSKGDRVIDYDTVSEGSHLAIKSGMTMYVGTAPGLSDKGKVRVRSATANQITAATNSHIDWADNDFLTVVRFWEIQAVYPRQIDDPGSDDPVKLIYYKDYDIAYTDQNSVLGSFICMGPHHAAFIDDGDVEVYYTTTGTFNLRAENMVYDWHFEGGTPTGSTSSVPGWVSYDTPGHYTTTLTVTTGGGADDVSYRHVSIYNRPSVGTNAPIAKWELDQLSGDVQRNGYSARLKIRDDVSETTVRDGALVVIFAEDWYGSTKQSIGGNAENRQGIVFTGYIQEGTIRWNYRDGYVEFDAVSSTEVMKEQEGFSLMIASAADPAALAAADDDYPSAWVLVKNMNIPRAIYHYLRWHSTALLCNDFQHLADNTSIQYYDCNRESIYDAIQRFLESTTVGAFSCDRQGKMWTLQEPSSSNTALSETPPTGLQDFDISSMNWMSDPSITERVKPVWSFLEAGGVAYYGPTSGTFNAYLSEAPGSWPKYGGSVQRHQGLALTTQENLNILSGNMFAFANSRYPSVTMDMVGNYRHLDIAPREYVNLTVDTADTPRGIQFTQKRFSPFSLVWNYNANKEVFRPTLSVRELTQGFQGDTLTIPNLPPTEPEDGGSVDQPPIVVPPMPPPVLPPMYGSSEYFVARFNTHITVGSIEATLTLGDFKTNSTAVGGVTNVSDISGDVWLVSIWIQSRHTTTPYSLQFKIYPCPGQIADLMSVQAGGNVYIYDAISSVAVSGLAYQFANKTYSFPVLTQTLLLLAGVKVVAPIVSGVEVNATAVGIKIAPRFSGWTSVCPLPGGG